MIKQHQHQAFEMQKFTKPLSKRLFYALTKWATVVLTLAATGVLLSSCDGLAAAVGTDLAADREDAEALSSREWAGQQVCGPESTAVWHGDVLECLRNRTEARVAGK